MDFEAYLHSKKIDSATFKLKEAGDFSELESLFNQVHRDSFTAQKLFLINPLRRKYTWKEKKESVKPKPHDAMPAAGRKPKIAKPKI